MSNQTRDQIAAIMLQYGTPEQQKEAIEYCSIINKTLNNTKRHLFELTDDQYKMAIEWYKTHECTIEVDEFGHKNMGAIGGGMTFSFTPTGLGNIETVSCACGSKLNLTEFDKW